MALNETGPESRYPREGKGRGKCRDVIDEEAMIHVEQRPQLLELSRADRELVCQRQIPATDKARALVSYQSCMSWSSHGGWALSWL